VTARQRATAGPPTRDRSGYYATPNGRFMSVTTILSNGIPKPALMHWAAFEAAQCAVDNVPALIRARGQGARDEMRQWIQRAAERKRDTAANLGTTIHGFLEAQILGAPTPEFTDEQLPFIEAFARFLDDWQPEFEASELTVANPEHGYAGTLDAIARIPSLGPDNLMVDWKTGKSIYPEVGMQLAAYRRCTVGWTRPDGVEVAVPATSGAMVLHLRPEHMPGGEPGGYAFVPVKTDDDVMIAFLAAKIVAEAGARDSLFDSILSAPLAPPVKEAVA
jgi:hypothetical protein